MPVIWPLPVISALDGGRLDDLVVQRHGEELADVLQGVVGEVVARLAFEGELDDRLIGLLINAGLDGAGVELVAGEDDLELAGGAGGAAGLAGDVGADGYLVGAGVNDVHLAGLAEQLEGLTVVGEAGQLDEDAEVVGGAHDGVVDGEAAGDAPLEVVHDGAHGGAAVAVLVGVWAVDLHDDLDAALKVEPLIHRQRVLVAAEINAGRLTEAEVHPERADGQHHDEDEEEKSATMHELLSPSLPGLGIGALLTTTTTCRPRKIRASDDVCAAVRASAMSSQDSIRRSIDESAGRVNSHGTHTIRLAPGLAGNERLTLPPPGMGKSPDAG